MILRRSILRYAARCACITALITAACSPDDNPAGPQQDAIAAGRIAFEAECAICHTARDGFDIAFFGFADADIVRRAVKHVDESTANDIVAYIHSLDVTPVGRTTAPFQPGGTTISDDALFWSGLFGEDRWPDDLTPAQLRAIDVRVTPVPLRMPLWSVEEADTDWLADTPLDSTLLDHAGGALRSAIDDYHAAPSSHTLRRAIDRFREASETGPGAICGGAPGAERRARECFEARRWLSTLAAVHSLREGVEPDIEAVQLWWDTGKVAQAVYFIEAGNHTLDMVSSWLYLAWSFNPARFPNEGGYLEQFLQLSGRLRMAAFTALRRMVSEEDVHDAQPAQRVSDAYIAAVRGPPAMRAGITRFAFEFLDEWLAGGGQVGEEGLEEAILLVGAMYDDASKLDPRYLQPGQIEVIEDLRDRLLARLQAGS